VQLFNGCLYGCLLDADNLLQASRNPLLGVTHFALQSADFALKIGVGTLQSEKFRFPNEAAFQEIAFPLDLLVEQLELLVNACDLYLASADAFLQGIDAFLDGGDLALEGLAPCVKCQLLAVQDHGDVGFVAQRQNALGERYLWLLAHLALKAGVHCHQPRVAEFKSAQLCFGRRFVKGDQSLIGFDDITFTYGDVPNNAALQMLNGLVLTGGDEHTGRHYGSCDRRRAAPNSKSKHAGDKNHDTKNRRRAGGSGDIRVPTVFAC
jgi:hypothetical protein